MAWLGMNDDEVNAQGNVLQQQAEAIQQLITKVDQEVESLKQNWQGDDSRQFEQEWTGTHRPELQKAQKLLAVSSYCDNTNATPEATDNCTAPPPGINQVTATREFQDNLELIKVMSDLTPVMSYGDPYDP